MLGYTLAMSQTNVPAVQMNYLLSAMPENFIDLHLFVIAHITGITIADDMRFSACTQVYNFPHDLLLQGTRTRRKPEKIRVLLCKVWTAF